MEIFSIQTRTSAFEAYFFLHLLAIFVFTFKYVFLLVTCLVRGLHRVPEKIRKHYLKTDEFGFILM